MAPVYITLPNKDRSVLPHQQGTGNYTVKLSETLSFPRKHEAFLMSATIPYSWYNVNENNNTLKLPGKTLRLTPGNYNSAAELVTAVNGILTAGETLTLNSATMRSKIVITNDHTISGPLLKLLGFSPTASLAKGTHVSPNLVDITDGVNGLLVYISIIENTYVGSFSVPLLATIPLGSSQPGDIIQYSQKGPDYEVHALNTQSFQTIEVDVRDTRGNAIDFNNYSLDIKIGIRKTQQ